MRFHHALRRFALAALTLTACAPGAEDEAAGEAAEPIVGGSTTLARPEVASFWGTGGCTATLISNRHFVTAAHCVGYAPLFRGNGGSSLRVDRPAGPVTYAVDRVFSQGRALGDADLAVGRLASPVPSSVATPATISTAQPANEWLTAMGYGCDSRSAGTGAGVKRFREYFYRGGSSNYLCPGDSGGPVFRGTLGSNGALVRVHSATRTDVFGNQSDVGADAVAYRQHLLALAGAMETQGVCYRAHVQDRGWMPAVCDGSIAGTIAASLRVEAVQIWTARPGVRLCYQAYVQDQGWLPEVCDGDMAGTVGQSRRLEAVRVRVAAAPTPTSVLYRAYVQSTGWQGEVSNWQVAGTMGQSRRLEALTVRLSP